MATKDILGNEVPSFPLLCPGGTSSRIHPNYPSSNRTLQHYDGGLCAHAVGEVAALLSQAEAALGAEPVAGEIMDHVRQRSIAAERLAVKALIAAVRRIDALH